MTKTLTSALEEIREANHVSFENNCEGCGLNQMITIENEDIPALLRVIEIAMEALKDVRGYSAKYEYPEHEIRHALAVEMPHEIDEALAHIESLLTQAAEVSK